MFNDISKATNWIESIKKFGDKLDLSRMELACTILGHPEKKLNVIHIAGTNGKGSTVSYLKYILLEQGYNVGTFTSPYIVRFNERITYNYNDISNDDLLEYINIIYSLYNEVLDKFDEVITFFELITLISFMYFKDLNLDYAIYEVGLGGKLDATNIVNPIIGAITSISYDHMGVLGNTLEEIALNKLGIVKKGMPLITTVNQQELIPIFEKYTKAQNADLVFINKLEITNIDYGKITNFTYKGINYQISLLGNHQVDNAVLSIEIINQLKQRNDLEIENINIQKGLLKTTWPGRMEMFGNIVLDGAHNIGGTKALRESVKSLFSGKYIKVLYTSMADKEYFDNIQVIETFADEIHFTQFDYPRCESAENLYNVSNHENKFLSKNVLDTLKQLRNLKKNEILIITGSLYFVSYIRKKIWHQCYIFFVLKRNN